MYEIPPQAPPLCNQAIFQPFSHPSNSPILSLYQHLQIAAALVIKPVINCTISLTLRWRERYRNWKTHRGRERDQEQEGGKKRQRQGSVRW